MKCNICEQEKAITEFYKHHKRCKKCSIEKVRQWKKNNPDKVKKSEERCREKNREKIREQQRCWREKNRQRYRETAKKYRDKNRDKCQKRSLKHYYENKDKYRYYRFKNLESHREYSRNYRERNLLKVRKRCAELEKRYRKERPLEHQARKLLYNAVKKGELKRAELCSLCGKECKTEAHHSDYTKPLNVIWLCRLCHAGVHSMVIK